MVAGLASLPLAGLAIHFEAGWATQGTGGSPRAIDDPPGANPGTGADSAPPGAPEWKRYPLEAGPFLFPRDEGAHSRALEEWWYVNGHLRDGSGRTFDFMISFFKHGILSAGLYDSGSGAFLDTTGFVEGSRREEGRLDLQYGGSSLRQIEGRPFTYRLELRSSAFSLSLELGALRPPLPVGGTGIINMGQGASYYYVLTDLQAVGTVGLASEELSVFGSAWMDRQWGFWSPALDWDWLSVKLDDGTRLLSYKMFEAGPGDGIRELATVVSPDGAVHHYNRSSAGREFILDYGGYWRSPDTGTLYSTGWSVAVPGLGLFLTATPKTAAQEILFPDDRLPVPGRKPFCEAACAVSGTLGGREVVGQAFAETTRDYGAERGDLVISVRGFRLDGGHREVVLKVENTGGYALRDITIELTAGSPYDGGRTLGTYRLMAPRNSTVIREDLPDLGQTPLYLRVDPDNLVAETDEGNNLVAAVPPRQ